MLAMRFTRREKVIGFLVSLLLGVMIALAATFIWPGPEEKPMYDYMLIVAMIVTLFPPSAIDLLDRRWRSAIDDKLDEFVRDVAEGLRGGLSFTQALEETAKVDYGPLTAELRSALAKMGWGVPFDEALEQLAERVGTPLAHSTVALLNEVGRSGGRLNEILNMIYSHLREVKELERDRRRQMSPYVMIIYSSIGVYLFVVVILFTTLFSQVMASSEEVPFFKAVSQLEFHIWFLHMSVIESVVAGFVAGKMGEGVMVAGLKHILILLLMSLIVFTLVIPV
jgi:flagellar protein FlaJ